MEIKKVKEWIRSRQPQFEVMSWLGGIPDGHILSVKRLNDGVIFDSFSHVTYEGKEVDIVYFKKDLIHLSIIVKNERTFGIEFSVVDGKVVTRPVVKEPDSDNFFQKLVEINDIEYSLPRNIAFSD